MADETRCGCGPGMHDIPLPELNFTSFLLSLSSSALMHLGETPDPETGKVEFRPHLAKHTIDILGMLHKKIDEGLDPDEKKLLCGLLYDLRMKYVNKVK
jgi:hypothetical protein